MELKRPAKRARTTSKVAGKKAPDGAAEAEGPEETPQLSLSSSKVREEPEDEALGEQSSAQVLPPSQSPPLPEAAPKLSKRALKRMHVWEPVIKPPEDVDGIPPCTVPRANVVWLDNNTRVTLIPNSNSGVHTRRGAASLAAATAQPTSYLVYTKDPLTRVGRAGDQEVRVITGLLPGEDPRSILRKASLTSFATQRDGGEEGMGADKADENDSNADEDGSCGDDDEEKGGPNGVPALSVLSRRTKNARKFPSKEEALSRRNRLADVGSNRKRKCVREKDLDDATEKTQPARVAAVSATQAMLPPPYRRNRRLKRKMHITEETPVFAAHSELRDRMPRLFPKAPLSTEEDVLRSTLDWHDNPALVYARLLWEFAPKEFLRRAMRLTERGDNAAVDGASALQATKPSEEDDEGGEQWY